MVMAPLAAVVLVACYRPSAPVGAPCSSLGDCPSGLSCIANACVTGGTEIDAASLADAVLVDALPVDALPVDVAVLVDAMPDGMAMGDAPCTSFSSQFDTCGRTFGPAVRVTNTSTYNTDTHMFDGIVVPTRALVTGLGGPIEVVFIDRLGIDLGAILNVTGSVPLGIATPNGFIISGSFNVAAGGRSAAACGAGAGATGVAQATGSSGGGGGAFQGAGGASGPADTNGTPLPPAMGGAAAPKPAGPRGGCPGGVGGQGAAGGVGGGALYLVTPMAISITGAINTGGGGGGGGVATEGGGGGGGAGGMILLEAQNVTVGGVLAANGGGGGAKDGNGQDATPDANPALGGTDNSTAAGGPGGAAAVQNGTNGVVPAGQFAAGAGGGGAGRIRINTATGAATLTGVVSPAASTPCVSQGSLRGADAGI